MKGYLSYDGNMFRPNIVIFMLAKIQKYKYYKHIKVQGNS